MHMNKNTITYKDAGVDVKLGDALVETISSLADKTKRKGVVANIGGFGGLFDLKASGFKDPILVSGTDGVGTKLILAIESNNHSTIGIDLVAMCVNDILCQGAEPLFFLDYFATGKLELDQAAEVISGISQGCEESGAILLGGETAEMPGMYFNKHYDLAGFAVGAVEKDKIITGEKIKENDLIIGLASSGFHSNGFSLVRKIYNREVKNKQTNGLPTISDLLTPTKIYVRQVLNLMQSCDLKGIAHITGGGLTNNIPRILPKGLGVSINLKSWEMPTIFSWVMDSGPITQTEMLQTFNCGIGMVLIVNPEDENLVHETLNEDNQKCFTIGKVITSEREIAYY